MNKRNLLLLFFLSPFFLYSEIQDVTSLFHDLEAARYWDEKMHERFPITFNHVLSTGYFTTPSARMGHAGEIGIGFASVPPYYHLNGRLQLFSHLELGGTYRIFRGVKDPDPSPHGFKDRSDRGANIKLAFFTPEDSYYRFPGLAIGAEDFLGEKKFASYYVVATKVWVDAHLEASLGWGLGRFLGSTQGFFGALQWYPWLSFNQKWIKGFAFAAEVDPIDYQKASFEPHPEGRVKNYPLNFGLKYKVLNLIDLSVGLIRGDKIAYAASFNYNWGRTRGLFEKVEDPHPFVSPRDKEPIGCYRPENVMIQTMGFAFEEQGLQMTEAWLQEGGEKKLWISVLNETYRSECEVKCRIQNLLAALTPSNIDAVIVILESFGLPCQQYVYTHDMLALVLLENGLSTDIQSCRQEAQNPLCYNAKEIFYRPLDPWRFRISPRIETFFGNSRGKFKYDLGVKAEVEGFLPYNIFYDLQVSYTAFSTVKNSSDLIFFCPSKLPIVLTDYIRYRHQENFSFDRIYLQKNWNLGRGFFGKAALGYFQVNYAGLSGELIYYPARSNLAIGADGAVLKKRNYTGLGLQNKLRKLSGDSLIFVPYTTLQQYFVSLFWNIPCLSLSTKLSAGHFLAGDHGIRIEATRYFESGLRITGWMTFTNAYGFLRGEHFFNRGIAIELPLDIFFNCSSRRVWNYGLAAWLRDAGAFTTTGRSLFDIVNRERLY